MTKRRLIIASIFLVFLLIAFRVDFNVFRANLPLTVAETHLAAFAGLVGGDWLPPNSGDGQLKVVLVDGKMW